MKSIFDVYPGLELLKKKETIKRKISEDVLDNPATIRFIESDIEPDANIITVSGEFESYVCGDGFGFLRGLVKHKGGEIEVKKLVSGFIGQFMKGIIITPNYYYYYSINWAGEVTFLVYQITQKYNYFDAKYENDWRVMFSHASSHTLKVRKNPRTEEEEVQGFGFKHVHKLFTILSLLLAKKYLKGTIKVKPEDIGDGYTEEDYEREIAWRPEIDRCGYSVDNLNMSYLKDYSNVIVHVRSHLRHYRSGLVVTVREYKKHYRLDKEVD